MAWQDPLGTAASISSLLQIACQVTKFGYSYLSSVRDAHATREEYLRESRALVVVLLQLKQVLDSGDVQKHQDAATRARRAQLSAIMSDCENGLSKIEATLGKAMGFWGVFWPLQQEQIRDHIKAFQQYRGMLDSFVSANVLATTAATLSMIDPLVLSHECGQLLFAFPRPDTISKPRILTCPGTGKWFFESTHYQQWLLQNSSVEFIWCHGPPGVGKSGLASLVVDELMERQHLGQIHLCYFFCDFAAKEKQTLIHVLQCLVYQLIEQGDEKVVNCAKESLGHFDAFKNPTILAKVIAEISGLAKPLFLVLDAEDELSCRDGLRKYLPSFKNSGCRILITSRDRSPSGSNATTPTPMAIIELKMECPVEDIIKYATERFQESPFQFQISAELMNLIVQKSNGIFLIAHILIEHLLQQTSVLEMKKVLRDSPTEINEVFESSLQLIDNQPPALSRLAHRVIGWIINARQLLTVAAMTHGFAVEDGIDEVHQDGLTNSILILRVCAGLVTIDETKTVRLVHTSVYEFFSTRKAGLKEVQVDIARSCIRYLCLKPMSNGPAKDVSELRKRLEDLPFLHYASHYWGAHIQDESSEDQLRTLILGLLANENTRLSAVQSLQFNSEVGNTTIAADFFASIPTNQAALHLSAYWGLSSISRGLIDSGADTTPRDSELWTPLHWAAANGHDRAVAVLIEAKSDLNAKDSEGWTPLFWASFHGHIFVVQILLRAGADHRAKSHRGLTALDWSIWRDELEIARTLLSHSQPGPEMPRNMSNSNISMQDLQDIGKRLGLEYFRGDGYEEYLDDRTGDRFDDGTVTFSSWMLKLSKTTDKRDLTRPLEGRLSSSTILDIDGQFGPPVSKSIWRTWSKSCVQASKQELLYVMKNPGNWKSNLLQSAIMTSDLAPARLLVELGADVNAKGDGLSPIFAALDADDPQFLELLIANGADVSFIPTEWCAK